jgi:hypothetical protein
VEIFNLRKLNVLEFRIEITNRFADLHRLASNNMAE